MRYLFLLILFLGLAAPWVVPDTGPTSTDDSYTDAALDCNQGLVPSVQLDLESVDMVQGGNYAELLAAIHDPGCDCCSADSATHHSDLEPSDPALAVLHFGTSTVGDSVHRSDRPSTTDSTRPTADSDAYGYQAPARMDC